MDKKLRNRIDKVAMVIGFGVMIGYSFEGFREPLGVGMHALFGPLTVLPIHIVILIMALITGVYTSVIQKYTVDWESMKKHQTKSKEMQAKMKGIQKELKEAQADENKYKTKKLEKKREEAMKAQAEMMKDQSDMMMNQMKPMGYTMPVVIPIFGWIRYIIYNAPIHYAGTIMSLPLLGDGTLGHSATNVFGKMPYWFFWYMMCSFLIGQMIRKVMNIGVS